MGDKVVRLLDRVPGIAASDHADLCDWLLSWAEVLKAGDHGTIRSLCVVVEAADGQLALLSQSSTHQDLAHVLGLLTIAAHRRADGGARIEDLTP